MSEAPQSPFGSIFNAVKIPNAEMLRHGYDQFGSSEEVAMTTTLMGWRPKTIPFWKEFRAVSLDSVIIQVTAEGWLFTRYRFRCITKDDDECVFSFVSAHPSRWLKSMIALGVEIDDPCQLHARPLH